MRVSSPSATISTSASCSRRRPPRILRDRRPRWSSRRRRCRKPFIADQVDHAAEALLLADRRLDATQERPNFFWSWSITRPPSAFSRSIRLTTIIRGRPNSSATFQPSRSGPRRRRRRRRRDGRVGGAHRADHLRHEDAVAGRVDQVDLVLLPLERSHREADRDLPFDLLGVEIGRCRAVVDATEAVDRARLVKERRDERRLPDAVVAGDGHVTDGGCGILFHAGSPLARCLKRPAL